MRQLIRRLRTCDSGAGVIEYTLLMGILALGLTATLMVYRNAVGKLTDRTTVTVSKQAGRGYSGTGSPRKTPTSWRPVEGTQGTPSEDTPEDDTPEPDSTLAAAWASY